MGIVLASKFKKRKSIFKFLNLLLKLDPNAEGKP